MPIQDLSFTQINTAAGTNIFSISGDVISCDVNLITGDTFTALSDTGIIEFCFKLMKLCYAAQEAANGTATTERLTSFSRPFYGTVQETSPPTISASITITGTTPLDIDSLIGRNS